MQQLSVHGMCAGARWGRGQHASSVLRTLDQPLVLSMLVPFSQRSHGMPYGHGIRAMEQADLAAALAEAGLRRQHRGRAAPPAGASCARLLVGHSTRDSPQLLCIALQ